MIESSVTARPAGIIQPEPLAARDLPLPGPEHFARQACTSVQE
jgi:hypothetical protein